MSASKLSQYQAALRHLGDSRLDTLADDVEARYALDDAWDASVAFVLRQAPWRFALKHATLVAGGALVNGYTTSLSYPADWLRTAAVYVPASSGRECPFDFREAPTQNALSVNITQTVVMRYVSTTYLDPSAASWPEHFSAAHAAYLAFSVANRDTGNPAAAGRMSQLFASLLPEAVAVDADPENVWLPHQRSGAYLRVARTMIDEGFWRFAMPVPSLVATTAGGGGGFRRQATIPTDSTRTHALYQINAAGQRRPIDIRERNGVWYTNETSFYAEYVSATLAMDSTKWPDHYMRAVLRQLQFDTAVVDGDKDSVQPDGVAWKDALAATLDSEADPADPWLPHQLSGVYARCLPAIISKGYWRFALKTAQFVSDTDQDPVPPDSGYPFRFTLPADWFKTHAIFVPWNGVECPIDIREHEGHWSTSARSFLVRYVSTAALDPKNWPDSLAEAVLDYLEFEAAAAAEKKDAAAEFAETLSAALSEWSQPEHPWLRFQLDGRYIEAIDFVLGAARWRFAIKTVQLTADVTANADGTLSGTPVPTGLGDGSISPSYSATFRKPGDWLRTIWLYRLDTSNVQVNTGFPIRDDIDFRDEGGAWHANWDTIQVRYLSMDAFDSTRGRASFRNAVLAWLQHEEARADPKMAGIATAKLKIYEDAVQRAEEEDDSRERPPVNKIGRFVQGRFGPRWITDPGAGSGGASSQVVLTGDGQTILTP